ncbi:MAG TPA: TldD/PmbA family protein [Bryobacteraceae bacterium]|nr:TldD/PmbA family protein [Bryobacteraceae bacterium]
MPVSNARETPLLTQRRAEEIFTAAAAAARALGVRDVEVLIGAGANALTRFANNTIHQNVAERSGYLSVRALVDGRTARASTNRLDPEGIRHAVEQAVMVAKLQAPDPELLPLAESASYADTPRHFARTAAMTPGDRAKAVKEAIAAVEAAAQTAAGIYATGESVLAILNTNGVSAYHAETMAVFSITALAKDSSGWAKKSSCDASDLNPLEIAEAAALKAANSRGPAEIAPGRYTVVLEPSAVLDLVGQISGDFSATALRDERSFLTGRLGAKLFGENISVYDDVYHARQSGSPFDGEGVPRQRVALVENGVVRNVVYSRQAATHAGAIPTGHGFPVPNEYGEAPANIVIAGGESSVEQMIASTDRGVLVTRLWYIREVDPYQKIMTGMTRDGTFLIEKGKLTRGLKNFRFNQNLIELLSNVEALSPVSRASGEEMFDMVVPAMKVRDFNFTEVTRF